MRGNISGKRVLRGSLSVVKFILIIETNRDILRKIKYTFKVR